MWNRALSILPEVLRNPAEMCSQGITVACTYIFSKQGEEIDNVIDKLIQIFQSKFEENVETPDIDTKLSPTLGYICWSEGRVSGLSTIRKVGKAEVTPLESQTKITVLFDFQDLKLEYNRCGYENGPVLVKGKCLVNLGEHKFKLAFKVENMQSFLSLLFEIWKKDCILKLLDLEFISLKDFGFNMVSRTGNKGSTPKYIIRKFVNILNGKLRKIMTCYSRYALYYYFSSGDSYVCKDQSLEALINQKYPGFLEAPSSTSPKQFQRVCGDRDILDITGDQDERNTMIKERLINIEDGMPRFVLQR